MEEAEAAAFLISNISPDPISLGKGCKRWKIGGKQNRPQSSSIGTLVYCSVKSIVVTF
jgi:hypothetical protein